MAPKYRHRGYRDNERDDDREPRRQGSGGGAPHQKALSPEQRSQMRGLRVATDREAREVVRCPNCGKNVESTGPIASGSNCPHCRAALHCCRTCMHFDSGARWECSAAIEERVGDKNAGNSCPSFDARLVLDATGKRSGSRGPSDPRSQFENLFKR